MNATELRKSATHIRQQTTWLMPPSVDDAIADWLNLAAVIWDEEIDPIPDTPLKRRPNSSDYAALDVAQAYLKALR